MQHLALDEDCTLGELIEKLWAARTVVKTRG